MRLVPLAANVKERRVSLCAKTGREVPSPDFVPLGWSDDLSVCFRGLLLGRLLSSLIQAHAGLARKGAGLQLG